MGGEDLELLRDLFFGAEFGLGGVFGLLRGLVRQTCDLNVAGGWGLLRESAG
jgi:hypothetical protein